MTRRRTLLGAAALAATSGLARTARAQITTLDLRPVHLPVKLDDWVAPGLRREVLIRWGDRVLPDAPDWAPREPMLRSAGAQFGWDARLAGLVEPPVATDGVPRLVLAVAHPTVDPAMAWPGGRDRPAVAAAMQGASILNLEKSGDRWLVVDGGFQSRRLDGDTLCRWQGPAATASAVQGVLGPQGGCATPWGSLLLAEGDPASWLARLRDLDPRWAEASRYGWVIEFDPLDPQSVPVKRSALGRVGAAATLALQAGDGRAVVLMADGQPGGFLYRFVSTRQAGEPDALDEGTLSVAQLGGETLRWVALPATAATDPAAAARGAGGSPLDTPAGLARDPRHAGVLLACRGDQRIAGRVLDLQGDPAAAQWESRLVFVAGDPTEGGRYGRGQPPGALPRNPATLAVDQRGRLWIGTDQGGRAGQQADAVFACDLDGPGRGVVLPAYAAPRGAAIGGAVPTPGSEAVLAMVRHPGATPGASFAAPATRWPAFDPALPPRTTLVSLSRGGAPVGG